MEVPGSELARSPAAIRFRPCSAGVVLRGSGHQSLVVLQPVPFPLHSCEPFVRQEVDFVPIAGQERIPYGPLVGGSFGQSKGAYHPLGVHYQRYFEAIDPLALGGTPPEARLPQEEPLARRSHPHHSRHQGGVQDALECRRFGEFSGEGSLHSAHLWLQGSDAPTLRKALGTEVREVGAQEVRPSKTPEVALAAEAKPLSEYSQRQNLRITEQGRPTDFRLLQRVVKLPPVVYLDVQ